MFILLFLFVFVCLFVSVWILSMNGREFCIVIVGVAETFGFKMCLLRKSVDGDVIGFMFLLFI